MARFNIVVFEAGMASYPAGGREELADAMAVVSRMAEERYVEDGVERFLFDGGDDIVIFGEGGRIDSVWNRRPEEEQFDLGSFDFYAYLLEQGERAERKLIGFQLTDLGGETIHGADADPFQLTPSDVFTDSSVLTAKD